MVIGASIAGLCAARVLSQFFGRVTVFERDELPDAPANRATVPQDRHFHLLLSLGAIEFEKLFPGLLNDMLAAGVPMVRNRDRIYLAPAGHALGFGSSLTEEFTAYVPSRPHLEWQLRKRVQVIDNAEIVRRSVQEPRFDAARQRVTGVLLDGAGSGEFVSADLVVDAAGRGTRLPVWLSQWGYQRPAEDTLEIGVNYASQLFRIPDGLLEEKVVVTGASVNQPLAIGSLYYEDGIRVLTTFGVANTKPPATFPEMLALAEELLPTHVAEALAQAEPIGEPAYHAFPASKWRRYDKLRRFPAGIVPIGDAVASFNPTYGQGMTMAALQAGHLLRALQSPNDDLARQLNRATAKTTYPVWLTNAIGDVTFHAARAAHIPWWWRSSGVLFDQFLEAAETEPVLAEWFLRRFCLLDHLHMVPAPPTIGRAVVHGLRVWARERREDRRAAKKRRLTTLRSP